MIDLKKRLSGALMGRRKAEDLFIEISSLSGSLGASPVNMSTQNGPKQAE